MPQTPSIPALQAGIIRTWKKWRKVPDGNHFKILTRQVGIFVHAVVQDALKEGTTTLTSPIPHVGRVAITVAVFRGKSTIVNHSHVTDFNEVVNDYLTWLCNKYLLKPDTQHVQSPAYIRMGIVMRAYSMERGLKNTLQKEQLNAEAVMRPSPENEIPDTRRLKTLWFYPCNDETDPVALPRSFQGLSLRYLYVALRHNAGARLTDIAAELDIHSSRLTALKKEYTRLFPEINSGAWLYFVMDYKPVRMQDTLLHKLNLKGVHRRYSLLKSIDDKRIQMDILRSKYLLWHLLQFAALQAGKPGTHIREQTCLTIPGNSNMSDMVMIIEQDNNHISVLDFQPSTQKKGGYIA